MMISGKFFKCIFCHVEQNGAKCIKFHYNLMKHEARLNAFDETVKVEGVSHLYLFLAAEFLLPVDSLLGTGA